MKRIVSKSIFTIVFVFFGFIFLFVPKSIYAGCTALLPDGKCYLTDECNTSRGGNNCTERCSNVTGGSAGIAVDGTGTDQLGDYCWWHEYSCTSPCSGGGNTQCSPATDPNGTQCGSQFCCSSAKCCPCGCKAGGTDCGAACCAAKAATGVMVTPVSSTKATVTWTNGTGNSQRLYVGTDINQVFNDCPDGTGSGTGCVLALTGLSKNLQTYTTDDILQPNTLYYWEVVSWNAGDCNKYAMVPALSSCQMSPASLNLQAGQSAQLETLTGGLTNATVSYSDEGNSVSFNPAITQNFNTAVSLDSSAATGNGHGGTTASTTISTSNGSDLLVASISMEDSSTMTVSSVTSPSLTWTKLGAQTAGTLENLEIWYAYSTGTLSNERVTATLSSSGHAAIGVVAYSNAAGVNGILNLTSTSGSGKKSATGNVTPSYSGSLIVGSLGVPESPSVTAGSGFTKVGASASINIEDRDSNTVDSEVGTSISVPISWNASDVYALMSYEISPVVSQSTLNATTVTAYSAGSNKISSTVTQNGTYLCSSTIPYTTITAGPHWQVKDGDVTTNGDLLTGVTNNINTFDLIGDGGYPGVPMYGGTTTDLTSTDVSTNPPFGWLANSPYSVSRLYNSTYFLNAVPSDVTINKLTGTFDQTALDGGVTDPDGYTWFMYDATSTNLPLNIGADINVGSKKVILMVKGGDINLSGNINLTDGHGFFLGVASGNINVASSVTTLEGVYVTDGNFNTGTNNTNPGTDAELVVRGTVAAYGGMNLQRNLSDNTGPSELFEYAPDQELLFPAKLSYYPSAWREVAP